MSKDNILFEEDRGHGNQRSDQTKSSMSTVVVKKEDANNSIYKTQDELFSDQHSIEQRYRKQIDFILDNLHEKMWTLFISKEDLYVFGYSSKSDFEEKVLLSFIEEMAKKRNLDFDYVCNTISSRIKWKVGS